MRCLYHSLNIGTSLYSLLEYGQHNGFINGINTWDDWHLIPQSLPVVTTPSLDSKIVKIPGSHGFVDLSDAINGHLTYSSRNGSWTFIAHPDYSKTEPWNVKLSKISSYLNKSKKFYIQFEDDPSYFYTGQLTVDQWSPGENWSQVTINYTLMPFKYEITFSDRDWPWDIINFNNSLFRDGEYSDIEISENDGYVEINCTDAGDGEWVPQFTVNSKIDIKFGNIEKSITGQGNYTFDDIRFSGMNNKIKVKATNGSATLTIRYRRTSL